MAGVTRSGGYPDYSSSGTIGFIPEVWSGKLVQKFYAATVFGSICSTEYEGEIKGFGDNIIIRTVPDVSVSDYTINSGFTPADYQVPQSTLVELPINKAKKFLYRINTVDRAQSDLDLASVFADEASMKLKIEMDRDLLANVLTDVATANQGTAAGVISGNLNLGSDAAPVQITASNVLGHILDHAQALDEQNVSDEGRWMILPTWMIQLLKESDLKQVQITGDDKSTYRSGIVGVVDRYTIYRSNLLTVTDAATDYTNIISGHKAGLAWASQIVEMEQVPNYADFGYLVRGLCVYGFKGIEGKYLTHGRVYQ